MLVTPNTFNLDALAALVAAAAPLNGAIVKLIQADIALSADMIIADLDAIEADFSGYAASSAITWGTPALDEDNNPRTVGSAKNFTTADPTTVGNSIYGYYVTSGDGLTLLYAEKFASPISMQLPIHSFTLVPVFGATYQP